MADVSMIRDKLRGAAQALEHVPGRGDPDRPDKYRVILTKAERDFLIAAISLPASEPGEVEKINFIKAFLRAQPSCLHLHCTKDCNPMSSHCARAADVFAAHNAALANG